MGRLVTAVASSSEIGEGTGEARAVFGLDSTGQVHQRLLDHVNLLDGNILIEPRCIEEAVPDLAQFVARQLPIPQLAGIRKLEMA